MTLNLYVYECKWMGPKIQRLPLRCVSEHPIYSTYHSWPSIQVDTFVAITFAMLINNVL